MTLNKILARREWQLAAMALLFALASLGVHRSTATAALPPLSYVAFGDSLSVWNDNQSYPADYTTRTAAALNASVTLTNVGVGGFTSTDQLSFLRQNGGVRSSIAAADIITWNIGINDLTIPREQYKDGTCGGADGQGCLRAAVDLYRANLIAIIAEVRGLNSRPNLVLRTMDVYDVWSVADSPDETRQVLRGYLDALNAQIRAIAPPRGVLVADVLGAFNGADGTAYPTSFGYLSDDGLHPSVAGSAAMAGALRRTGYAPLAPDGDGDGIIDALDNCPTVPNAGQENHDGNLIDLSRYGKLYDDMTWPNSDTLGDACDPDADNDGLPNAIETAYPVAWCPTATGPTNPLAADTDGDLVLDAAECALGTDPTDPASVPPLFPAGNGDHDGLSDAFELTIGTDPSKPDTDGDGVLDGVEYKNYNTNPLSQNTDGDKCTDGKEVASVNADQIVNSVDLSQVAKAYGPASSRVYITDFDLNKDGRINSTDMVIATKQYGYCR